MLFVALICWYIEYIKSSSYAVITPVQIMWIANLVNAKRTLDDIQKSFPEATLNEIVEVVYGVRKTIRSFLMWVRSF